MSQWKEDVASEIAKLSLANLGVDEVDVRAILDRWAPLSVDEAQAELDAMDEESSDPLPPEKVEASVRYVMESCAAEAGVTPARVRAALAAVEGIPTEHLEAVTREVTPAVRLASLAGLAEVMGEAISAKVRAEKAGQQA